jgi:hypothetical protein
VEEDVRPGLPLVLIGLLLVLSTGPLTAGETIAVSRFAERGLQDWQSRAFEGETGYSLVADPASGSLVLKAVSGASASGLYRKLRVDLTRTPFLNWSWRVTRVFPDIDERTKSGDDFPARIFVVVERGPLGASSLALNYVWSSGQPAGSLWSSPYSERVKLLALDAGASGLGTWAEHRRDLRADLRTAFGRDITEIDAIALMTDTDDHGGAAETYYGEIWFSAD